MALSRKQVELYYAKPNSSKQVSAPCWTQFDIVYRGDNHTKAGFVRCRKCENVIVYTTANGNNGMNSHMKTPCGRNEDATQPSIILSSTSISTAKLPKAYKDKMKAALLLFVVLDFRPFYALEGLGIFIFSNRLL